MQGRRWEFLWLLASFIVWYLLQGVTCGLSAIFVSPYRNLTLLNFTQQARIQWLHEAGKPNDPVWAPGNTREDNHV